MSISPHELKAESLANLKAELSRIDTIQRMLDAANFEPTRASHQIRAFVEQLELHAETVRDDIRDVLSR